MKDTNDVLKITKLAEAGDVAAMIDLARRYEGGLGVDKDVDTSFWWWKKAADAGSADAQYEVSVWYTDGVHCVPDYQKSVFYCKRAAMQGHEEAIEYLEVLSAWDV